MTRPDDDDGPSQIVYGIHPVTELLEARRRQVERIFVSRDRTGGLGRILRQAREAGIPVTHLPREVLARKAGARAVHQGIAAQVAPLAYADAQEICRLSAAGGSGMLVLLDGVTDPRNLGAILRTCAGAAVDGVLLAGSAVGLTPVVAKASAGAVERIPVAREPKGPDRLRSLRSQGFRALALDPRAGTSWNEISLTGRIIFVAGGEERGVRPGLADACDGRVAIPLADGVESLNVAVALGVLVFEALRQRRAVAGRP